MSNEDKTSIFGIFKKDALPEGAMPIENFDARKFLGRWYEIGRINYYWEKQDLTNVFAEYSLNEDGSIKVENTGYDEGSKDWTSYSGKAKFRGDEDRGALEVAFFGPIWSGYNVIAIEGDYDHALIYGRSHDYLWFLSRTREMPGAVWEKYMQMAQSNGYDISRVNRVAQDKVKPEES